jgi:HSP20 family protein
MASGNLTHYRPNLPAGQHLGSGSLLFDLQRQMNRMFDDVFGSDAPRGGALGGLGGFPALEVSQDENRIEICAELPGVKEEDVDLTVEDGVLTLSGEKRCERKDESGYSERSYGRFERRITLPSNIDPEHCEADFKDGLLTVTIPKDEKKGRGRRIPLGRSSSTGKGNGGGAAEAKKH